MTGNGIPAALYRFGGNVTVPGSTVTKSGALPFAVFRVGSTMASKVFIILAIGLMEVTIARRLGPELYGLYSVAFSIAAVVAILSDAGLNAFATKAVSGGYSSAWHLRTLILGLKLPLFGVQIAVTAVLAARYGPSVLAFAWALLLVLIARGIFQTYYAILLGTVDGPWLVLATLFVVVGTGLGVLMNVASPTPEGAVAAIAVTVAAGYIAASIVAELRLRQLGAKPVPIAHASIPLGEVLGFTGTFFVIAVYCRATPVLLQHLGQSVDAGLFTAAFRIQEAIMAGFALITLVASPVFSACWAHHPDRFAYLLRFVTRAVAALAMLVAPTVAFTSVGLVPILYGDRYPQAVDVLIALSPGLAATCVSTVFSVALSAMGAVRIVAVSTLTNLLILVGTSWLGLTAFDWTEKAVVGGVVFSGVEIVSCLFLAFIASRWLNSAVSLWWPSVVCIGVAVAAVMIQVVLVAHSAAWQTACVWWLLWLAMAVICGRGFLREYRASTALLSSVTSKLATVH